MPDSCVPPDLDEYLERILDAFWELSTCRSLGFGAIGPIPWSAVREYAVHLGIADDELLAGDLLALVHELDDEFLTLQAQQAEAQRGKSKPAKVR